MLRINVEAIAQMSFSSKKLKNRSFCIILNFGKRQITPQNDSSLNFCKSKIKRLKTNLSVNGCRFTKRDEMKQNLQTHLFVKELIKILHLLHFYSSFWYIPALDQFIRTYPVIIRNRLNLPFRSIPRVIRRPPFFLLKILLIQSSIPISHSRSA